MPSTRSGHVLSETAGARHPASLIRKSLHRRGRPGFEGREVLADAPECATVVGRKVRGECSVRTITPGRVRLMAQASGDRNVGASVSGPPVAGKRNRRDFCP
ncbi:hypothetical protein WDZ92_48130, partial [Nostoc sp. NIES-2111]